MIKQVEEAVPPRRQALSQEGAWHLGGNKSSSEWPEGREQEGSGWGMRLERQTGVRSQCLTLVSE